MIIKIFNISRNYEMIAYKILDKCYEAKEKVAEELLTKKITEFDDCSNMEMAEASYSLTFVSHVSFQEALEKRWYNEIQPNCSTVKVLQLSIEFYFY